ncbi:MAG: hypothetical protein QOH70_2242 [Blastocatellia bacterium]|jgi:hypothetical protein|nr:hypothetical protein [Blastocatellia bacterium]
MSKAFVDTTVFTDAIIKGPPYNKAARDSLKRYTETHLPTYAIKEFKAGPLSHHAWLHNKFATLKSFHKTLNALHGMAMSPRKYRTATALEALRDAAKATGTVSSKTLIAKYGARAGEDSVLSDKYRLAIRYRIFRAWKIRRTTTSRVVLPIPCYKEIAPYEERGLIEITPTKCDVTECSLASALKNNPKDLEKLKDSIGSPTNQEQQRRYQALRQLIRKPKEAMTEKMCRALGDAVFVFFAPDDSVILTTNTKDHEPLARALGKTVETP